MTSVNQVILTGKVAKPPQFHHQPDGTPVLQFSLELNDSGNISVKTPGRGHQGQTPKRTGLHPSLIHIVALGQLAQSRSELQSGQRLLVKGRLHQRYWETPEGRYRSRTEVIVSELHSAEENEANPQSQK
ncbi:MAG: single-stranded DNA-binding protein [Deltaproteobacteria bacterium]|nr:single-stranded DNA-binding protein [Deltaproteobacteria bacterium]